MSVELDLQNKKLELIQWLSVLEDVSVIEKIINLKKQENADWWNLISDEEKESIAQGLIDTDAGKLNPHAQARKLYEKWL